MPKQTITIADTFRHRVQQTINALHEWNEAILAARAREEVIGQPGRLEHDMRVSGLRNPLNQQCHQATWTLDTMEAAVAACGVRPQAFYTALGLERPALLPEGPHVVDWFEGQR